MRKVVIRLTSCVLCIITYLGCNNFEKSIWGVDPIGAESIYECDITPATEEFNVIEEMDDDGSRCVWIEHLSFPASKLYKLYSPNGNLRIIASGAQEQGGLDGYRIDYDEEGKVCNVINLGSLDNEEYQKLGDKESSVNTMKRWLQQSLKKVPMEQDSPFLYYDENGNIYYVKDIDIPSDHKARLFIKEWGPFWGNDIYGGQLGFFISVEKIKTTEGSYVNYLYFNGKLVAESAYWKGVFIKARTCNNKGAMVKMYSDRSINVEQQAYKDYWTDLKWYVD